MKWILIISFSLFLSLKTCTLRHPPVNNPDQKSAAFPDTVNFAEHVLPILEKKCNPCHFTGGKMYASMPFDQDSTLLNHQQGILKRMNEEEKAIIKKFIAHAMKSSSSSSH